MRFQKMLSEDVWTSPEGYTIEPRGGLRAYWIYGPLDARGFTSVGGALSLEDAKRMARQHFGERVHRISIPKNRPATWRSASQPAANRQRGEGE